MNTTEDYVSFETATLLKEKGFDYVSFYCYEEKGINDILWVTLSTPLSNSDLDNTIEQHKCYSIPTLQMAMKWLREKHKLHIWISHKLKQNKGLPWYYEIHNIETGTVAKIGDVVCGSYEVACEDAIKYCLEKLI